MTRILVPRGSAGSSSSSSSQSRSSTSSSLPSSSSSSSLPAQAQNASNSEVALVPAQAQNASNSEVALVPAQAQNASNSEVALVAKDDDCREEVQGQLVDEFSEDPVDLGNNGLKDDDISVESGLSDQNDEAGASEIEKDSNDVVDSGNLATGFARLSVVDEEKVAGYSSPAMSGSSCPPPPPVPPPVPPPRARASSANLNLRRSSSSNSNAEWVGASMRVPLHSARSSPTVSRPSSPRCHSELEGYNSADEQGPCFGPSYNDAERERQFEIDIRRVKGWEIKKMLGDGNCLFRAVADQVYGDSEQYDLVRQMCVDYLEQERDHFSQFATEGFTSYCQRKRRDKVYGNNVEIQALAEMYNRPIHIFSYGTEPINTFHGGYATDVPPIRLSFHHGNHYNSLVDPRRPTIGAGLGFSCLRGGNVNRDQVKAAIKAQQDLQIENALLSEGQLYSDLELTEKEIERMVMEASRIEYLTKDKFGQQLGRRESSTSGAEPSSSGGPSGSDDRPERSNEFGLQDSVLSGSMQMVLSMGFSYMQAVEAYSIFGDDVDSMIYYLVETSTGSSNRRKGKATQ